jgi:cation diffusion facilitator family transporter
MERSERFDSADRIMTIGFWVNAALMVMKLAAGYWGRSDAVFADGIESACDFIAIFAAMIALKLGRQPFDANHPYGHGRAESLAALLVSLVIGATGGWILYESVTTIVAGEFKSPGWIAIAVTGVTIACKEWLHRISVRTGKALESPALLAIAKDHRKDAITSVSTLVGVVGASLGWGIMDPLAAGLTSLFILRIGYQTLRDAAHDLVDGTAPADLTDAIRALAEGVDNVEHVHELRARRSGQYLIVDLKLDMDPDMTVKQSHDVATRVKKLIFDRYPGVGDVMIHINPTNEKHRDLIRL